MSHQLPPAELNLAEDMPRDGTSLDSFGCGRITPVLNRTVLKMRFLFKCRVVWLGLGRARRQQHAVCLGDLPRPPPLSVGLRAPWQGYWRP